MTRLSNKEYRDREYLTYDEVKQLIDAAYCRGRNGQRDAFLILMMFRHGLRAVEAANLKWSDVYFDRDEIWIERAKGSLSKQIDTSPTAALVTVVEAIVRRLMPAPSRLSHILHQYKCSPCGGYQLMREVET